MVLKLIRNTFTPQSTIGDLYADGVFLCHCLEDVVRPVDEPKVYGKTAIPYGRYRVVLTMSNRFKVILPLLVDVPGFAGVRIHSGNTAADTDGCLLPGLSKGVDFVGNSRAAMAKLQPLIAAAPECWLEIVQAGMPA